MDWHEVGIYPLTEFLSVLMIIETKLVLTGFSNELTLP